MASQDDDTKVDSGSDAESGTVSVMGRMRRFARIRANAADPDDDSVRLGVIPRSASGAISGVAGKLGKLRLNGSSSENFDDVDMTDDVDDPELARARKRGDSYEGWTLDGSGKSVPHVRGVLGVSHLESSNGGEHIDTVVRTDGRRMAIFEVQGVDIALDKVSAFAGALNSFTFHCQFLVRQHQPRLSQFREQMRAERAVNLSERIDSAADSLDEMLKRMETREGLMDRRFYVICEEEHIGELVSGLSRCQFDIGRLADGALRILLMSSLWGHSPADMIDESRFRFKANTSHIKTNNGFFRRTIELKVFPRHVEAGILQSLFGLGVPMDVSLQVYPIPSEQAIRNLESQRTKLQASANSQLKRKGDIGQAERIALEDVMRLRDQVMRGNERMFSASLCIAICADSVERLTEYVTLIRSTFTAILAQVDELRFAQIGGLRMTLPLCDNVTGRWNVVDTSTLALMFPFSPADLDRREGTLIGLDTRSRTLINFDLFDPASSQNMNTAILATSGAGKSFSAKLFMLRLMMRGVRIYVIDPEGEYVDTCIAAGGRVMTPGVEGQGMNPFLVTETGADLNERIGTLKKLVQVMINGRLSIEQLSRLDNAMVNYYGAVAADGAAGTFSGLYSYLDRNEPEIALMVRPFFSGSSRYLLSDEGADMLSDEPEMTVFNLRLVENEMRAAAGMVCAETVWTMAARDPRPRLLVVDEVWSIIAHPDGADFMINTAKRARKHLLGLVSITQDVQDLLTINSNEGIRGNSGRALLQNASYKLLLRQDPACAPLVQETFQLTKAMAMQLAGYATGDGLLLSPDGSFPIRVEATAEEKEIIEWAPGLHH